MEEKKVEVQIEFDKRGDVNENTDHEKQKIDDYVGQVIPPDQTKEKIKVEFPPPSNFKQEAVVGAFKHAWKGYRTYAWGHDHLKPITCGYNDWFNLGLSIVDSLDTMYIMNLKDGKP